MCYIDSFFVDDAMGDMPTPERLVPPDMPLPKPNGGEKLDIDNKVANFLAVSILHITHVLTQVYLIKHYLKGSCDWKDASL